MGAAGVAVIEERRAAAEYVQAVSGSHGPLLGAGAVAFVEVDLVALGGGGVGVVHAVGADEIGCDRAGRGWHRVGQVPLLGPRGGVAVVDLKLGAVGRAAGIVKALGGPRVVVRAVGQGNPLHAAIVDIAVGQLNRGANLGGS